MRWALLCVAMSLQAAACLASHPSFDDDELGQLKAVPGSAFEVVEVTGQIYTPYTLP